MSGVTTLKPKHRYDGFRRFDSVSTDLPSVPEELWVSTAVLYIQAGHEQRAHVVRMYLFYTPKTFTH